MRIQQDKLSSEFVVNSMCLGVGTISSESGVDFPESFSTMGPKHFKTTKLHSKFIILNNKSQMDSI